MTAYPGYDNPQLTLDAGHRRPGDTRCDACGQPVDTTTEHWTLTTGRTPRFDLLAVAHDDTHADGGGACFAHLRTRWTALAASHGAGTLRHATPDSYRTLLDDDLHCGTPLQILTAAGTWLDGHYEITHTPRGPRPTLYIPLGGLNRPDAPLHIPDHALLRRPDTRRR
jgi:hypothetical protein